MTSKDYAQLKNCDFLKLFTHIYSLSSLLKKNNQVYLSPIDIFEFFALGKIC